MKNPRENSGRRWVGTTLAKEILPLVAAQRQQLICVEIFLVSNLIKEGCSLGPPRIPKSLHPSRVEKNSDPGLTCVT